MIFVALAILLAGVSLGALGRKRWSAIPWRTWRPGAALLALAALAMGALLLARGAWWEGLLLGLAGAALIVSARRRPPRPAAPAAAPSSAMGRREAASMLGLETEATAEAVEEAYRRLIRRAHPDTGGSAGLAAQLNLARATLLEGAPKPGR